MCLNGEDKIMISYALLTISLCLMAYSIVSVIGVFTSGEEAIEILHTEKIDSTSEITKTHERNVSRDIGIEIQKIYPIFNIIV